MYSNLDDDTFDPAAWVAGKSKNPTPKVAKKQPEPAAMPESEPEPKRPQKSAKQPAPKPSQAEPEPYEPAYEVSPSVTNEPRRSFLQQVYAFCTDWRLPVFFGIVILLVCTFVLIVTASYFYNLSHDQSALLAGITDPDQIANTGGPVGAWTAHWLIYDWLGVGAFVAIFYFGALGLALLKFIKIDFWKLTFRCCLVAIAFSIIMGFLTYAFASPIYWGGRHGHYLNQSLMTLSGWWGAAGVSMIFAAALLMLGLNRIKVYWGRGCEFLKKRRAIRAENLNRQRQDIPTPPKPQPANNETESQPEPVDIVPETESSPLFSTEDSKHEKEEAPSDTNTPTLAPLFGDSEPCSLETEITEAQLEPEMQVIVNEIEQASDTPTSDSSHYTPSVFDPRSELPGYRFPGLELLIERNFQTGNVDKREMEENKQRITKTLNDYGIPISHIHATVGATVTLYEIIPAEGVRIAKIKRLEDDIALSLAALGIRIIAPIPGKGTIGIEVPNKDPQTVSIRSILGSKKFQESHMDLPMAMGTTISNEVFMADLCKMPHLLVAGATGMGKSVGLNAIIASLLYKKHPAELKMVLIDPKMVEFSLYSIIENHYLAKLPGEADAIITDPAKVVATLNSLCLEMDQRYALLKDAAIRNIKEYNEKFTHQMLDLTHGHRYMPYIVVIVDEFADLIMTAGKEVETPIARIAQKARAVGIHMILATQRPSTNVITGVIKANFPGRIAFRVFQMVDSRTILDRPGANQLIGRGDMLFSNNGKIDRVQCAFIDTPEVEDICAWVAKQASFEHPYWLPEYIPDTDMTDGMHGSPSDRDPLFEEVARYVTQSDTASTSSLQRRWSIGYNRAGKLMDQLEAAGIVGPSNGGKPRQVLMTPSQIDQMF